MDQPARGLLHCGDVSLDVMRMVYGRHNRRERRHHGANLSFWVHCCARLGPPKVAANSTETNVTG